MPTLLLILCTALAILLGGTPEAKALTATVSGTNITATYTEPVLNKDGSILKDLAKTTVYYKLGTAARVSCATNAASSLTGGADRTAVCTVPVLADQESDVTITVTATDISGNESIESVPVIQRIDRLAPGAPK